MPQDSPPLEHLLAYIMVPGCVFFQQHASKDMHPLLRVTNRLRLRYKYSYQVIFVVVNDISFSLSKLISEIYTKYLFLKIISRVVGSIIRFESY